MVNLGHIQIRCPVSQPGHFASVQESWDKGYGYWAMTTCYCIDQSLSLDSLCLRCTRPGPQAQRDLIQLLIQGQSHSQTFPHTSLYSATLSFSFSTSLPSKSHHYALSRHLKCHTSGKYILNSPDRMSQPLLCVPRECHRYLSDSPCHRVLRYIYKSLFVTETYFLYLPTTNCVVCFMEVQEMNELNKRVHDSSNRGDYTTLSTGVKKHWTIRVYLSLG